MIHQSQIDQDASEEGLSAGSETMAIDIKNLPRSRICYLEIPATDPHTSAKFYDCVFGWNIRRRDSAQPSFDDPSGVSGAFVTLKAAPEPGLLPSIWVDDINAMVASQIIYDRMSFKSEMLSDASQGSIWAQIWARRI